MFGVGLSLSSSFIASKPKGVAALPIPRIFADIFIVILPFAGDDVILLPKRKRVKGESIRDMMFVIPLLSAISIIPDQKHIKGAMVIKREKAFSMPWFSRSTRLSPPEVKAVYIMPEIIIKLQITVKMTKTSNMLIN